MAADEELIKNIQKREYSTSEEWRNARREAEDAYRADSVVFGGTVYDDQEKFDADLAAHMSKAIPGASESDLSKWKDEFLSKNQMREEGKRYYASGDELNSAVARYLDAWGSANTLARPKLTPVVDNATQTGGGGGSNEVVPGSQLGTADQKQRDEDKYEIDAKRAKFAQGMSTYRALLAKAQANQFKVNDLTPMSGPVSAKGARAYALRKQQKADQFTSADMAALRKLDKIYGDKTYAGAMPWTNRELAEDAGSEFFARESAAATARGDYLRKNKAAIKQWGGVDQFEQAQKLSKFYKENKGNWGEWLEAAGSSEEAFRKMSAKDKLRIGQEIMGEIEGMKNDPVTKYLNAVYAMPVTQDDRGYITNVTNGDHLRALADELADRGEKYSVDALSDQILDSYGEGYDGSDMDTWLTKRKNETVRGAQRARILKRMRERGSEWFPQV